MRPSVPRPLVALVACLAISVEVWSQQDRRILDTTAEVNTGRPGQAVDPPAVVAGGFIYTSGLVGLEATGRSDQPDVAAEVRRALERLKTVVEAAGSSLRW